MTSRPTGLLIGVALLAASLGALAGARMATPEPLRPDPTPGRRIEELEQGVAELRARLEALEARCEAPSPAAPTAAPVAPAPPEVAAPRASAELAAELDQIRKAQEHERMWRRFLLKNHVTEAQSNALMHACAEAQGKRAALFARRPFEEWTDEENQQLSALTDRVIAEARAILGADQMDGFDSYLCW